MSNILVTGGAGFIGSHLVERLLKENHNVIVFDNLLRGKRANLEAATRRGKTLRFVEADIRNAHLLDTMIERSDYVFHLAAIRINRCVEYPEEARSVMIAGTLNLLESCVKHKIKKIVMPSSASIYGTADYFPTDEKHHPYNDVTLYGAFKACNEAMLRAFQATDGLPYVCLRLFNVYGPRMDIYGAYTEVIIKWLDLIDKESNPMIYSDGNQALDFVYVDDVIDAFMRSMFSKVKNDVFNIGTGIETKLVDLAKMLIALKGSNLHPILDESKKQTISVQRRQADWSKAKEILEWQPKVLLEDGLQLLIDWRDCQAEK